MTFLSVGILWLLLGVPVLVAGYVYLLRRWRKIALHFPGLSMVKQGPGRRVGIRRHIPPALLLVSLCLSVVAMARPAAVLTLAARRGTIIMAIDVSGSMQATDITPSRITAAQLAAKSFVKERQREIRVAIVAFSSDALPVQAPTTDAVALDAAIDKLRPLSLTAIGSAVVTSLQTIFPKIKMDEMVPGFGGAESTSGTALNDPALTHAPPKRPPPIEPGSYHSAAIVLMTDGRNNTGPDPIEAARVAANLGVRIFTIGFGTKHPTGVSDGGMDAVFDEPTLKEMATMTKGDYFHAQSVDELTKIYQQLSTKLLTESEKTEISAIFAAGAIVFLVLSVVLSFYWFSVPF
jgi:Ca-activated chloride channel family protein